MPRVFLGIGANEGDRFAAISSAIFQLSIAPAIRVVQMAPIIETKPQGGPPQDDYLNTVVELETEKPPAELLALLKLIEKQLGRVPSGVRWGARPIDLDILLYDDAVVRTPDLEVPHARLHERLFVLEPLAQLAPDFIHPVLKKPVYTLLEAARAGEASCSK